MADRKSNVKRAGRGLYWGLFLLLVLILCWGLHLLGYSPAGIARGIKFLISSTVVDGRSRDMETPEPAEKSSTTTESGDNLLLRSIQKQREELDIKEERLNQLEARLEQEKNEIIRERKELEAARGGRVPVLIGRFSRYLPLLVLLSVGLWVGLVFYLVVRRAVSGRPGSGKRVPAPQTSVRREENLSGLKESLARMISDVEDVAGRVPDEIRQGSMALRDMIREADQRMGELRALLSQVALISQKEAAVRSRTDRSDDSGENRPGSGVAVRNKEVYDLAAEGLSEEEIARRLQLGIGEVQLILNLKRTGDEKK